MKEKDSDMLKKSGLFSGFSETELALFCGEGDIISAKRGDIVIGKDDFSRALSVMLEGRATVYKDRGDEHRYIMSILEQGGVFGMATLFYEQDKYPTSIVADTDCRILVFGKELVLKALQQFPAFSLSYIALLSERIHFLSRRLGDFAEGDCGEKLLRCLARFYQGGDIELPYSMQRFSQMLGIGRASLYRALDTLEGEEVFTREGRKFKINKPERLLKYKI